MKHKKYRVGELRKLASALNPDDLTREKARQALREHHKQAGVCQWFAACENLAVTTIPHPVLGEVPACQRCVDWYNRMK